MLTVEFEQTPNPDAMRVLTDRRLLQGSPRQFKTGDSMVHPLAKELLEIAGVVRTMIAPEFVTVVRKGPEVSWTVLRPKIALVLAQAGDRDDSEIETDLASKSQMEGVERHIEEVLERYVRPYLARHGGEAVLQRFDSDEGVAWIRMEGACGGCPSGALTLKRGIEQSICHWVPEVKRVMSIGDRHDLQADPKARFRQWIESKWGRLSGAA